MQRLSLLAIGALLFMACGGNGKQQNFDGVCGDGVVNHLDDVISRYLADFTVTPI